LSDIIQPDDLAASWIRRREQLPKPADPASLTCSCWLSDGGNRGSIPLGGPNNGSAVSPHVQTRLPCGSRLTVRLAISAKIRHVRGPNTPNLSQAATL